MNKDKEIYALGIGHNTPVFIDIAVAMGYSIAGLFHYNNSRNGEVAYGYKILGCTEDLLKSDLSGMNFVLTMGDMAIRKDLTRRILERGGILPTLIHPMSTISKYARIGEHGVIISQFVDIQADSDIEDGTIILSNSVICHTVNIGKYCFIASNAVVGALTNVENDVFIGQGAIVISHKCDIIGHNSTIGAGAVVTKSVKAESMVIGNPARVI